MSGTARAARAHGRDIRMKAKRNRYYLGLRELGKRQLYGRARRSVQICRPLFGLQFDHRVGFANSTSTKTE